MDSMRTSRIIWRGGEKGHFAPRHTIFLEGIEEGLGEQLISQISEAVIATKEYPEVSLWPHSVTIPPYLSQRGMTTKRRRTIQIIPSSTPVHNPLNCLNKIK